MTRNPRAVEAAARPHDLAGGRAVAVQLQYVVVHEVHHAVVIAVAAMRDA